MLQHSRSVSPDLFQDLVEGASIKGDFGLFVTQGQAPWVPHKETFAALKESLKASYGLPDILTGLGFGGFPSFYSVASLDC